ncbi:MAG: hypothetical protein ACYSU7_14375 [Planctomycetota bacterium]|jgi:hypothetical protein
MKLSYVLVTVALAFGAGISVAQTTRPAAPGSPSPTIALIDLPLKLPAVGNLGAVRQWRFGRLQSVETRGAGGDRVLTIRTGDGTVLRMAGPGPQLGELARISEWVRFNSNAPIRGEYVERMIAFDMDEQQRLIAMISLEPVFRDPNRLRRALGPR